MGLRQMSHYVALKDIVVHDVLISWGESNSSYCTLTLVVFRASAKCTVWWKLTSLPLVPRLLVPRRLHLIPPPMVPLPLIPPWYHIHQCHTHPYHFHNCPIQIVMVYIRFTWNSKMSRVLKLLLLTMLDLQPRVLLAEKRRNVDLLLCNNRLHSNYWGPRK